MRLKCKRSKTGCHGSVRDPAPQQKTPQPKTSDCHIHSNSEKSNMHFNPYIPHWDEMNEPLRPCIASIQGYQQLFERVRPVDRPAKVLLLGVTPELADANWLKHADMTAVDHSED